MSVERQSALVTGELDPALYGRIDLAKLQFGASFLENFIVDPKGGVFRRSGTRYVDELPPHDDYKLVPFAFSVTQTYVLAFTGYSRIHVFKDGGAVLNPLVLAGTYQWNASASPNEYHLFDINAGGGPLFPQPYIIEENGVRMTQGTAGALNAGEWAWGNVDALGYDTIYVKLSDLTDPDTKADFYVSSHLVLTSPYPSPGTTLSDLRYVQSADVLYLVDGGGGSQPRQLTRGSDHYLWTLSDVPFTTSAQTPTTPSALLVGMTIGASRYYGYAVSTVDANGEESLPSPVLSVGLNSGVWTAGGRVELSWTPVQGAEQYNVYKSNLQTSTGTSDILGWIGTVYRQVSPIPPQTALSGGDFGANVAARAFDGDASGAAWWSSQTGVGVNGAAYIGQDYGASLSFSISSVRINQVGGSGYGVTSALLQHSPDGATWTTLDTLAIDDAAGWQDISVPSSVTLVSARYWRLLANSSLVPSAHWIVYELEFKADFVPGVFIDDNITPDVGNTPQQQKKPFGDAGPYPKAVTLFEQRLFFGRTNTLPNTVWASQTGLFSNFAVSYSIKDTDAITAAIASNQVNEIRHLLPMDRVVVFTEGTVWILTHGDNSDALTPTSVQFKLQSHFGCSDITPLLAGGRALFLQSDNKTVRDLAYALETDKYGGQDMTLLVKHLTEARAIVDWTYQRTPFGIVWAVLDDGKILSMTYVPEQQVWAWTRHDVGGVAINVTVIEENGEDVVYALVKKGDSSALYGYVPYLVRMNSLFDNGDLKDAFFIDFGKSYDTPYTVEAIRSISPSPVLLQTSTMNYTTILANGDVIVLSSLSGYDSTDFSTMEGQSYEVSDLSATQFRLKNPTTHAYITSAEVGFVGLKLVHAGEFRKKVTTVSGLDHFEGETVTALYDGVEATGLTVTGGAITLPATAGRVHAGQPFSSTFISLPVKMKGRLGNKKNVVVTSLQLVKTRGGKAGRYGGSLYAIKYKAYDYGADSLFTGYVEVPIEGRWDRDTRIEVRQDSAYPMTLISIGDEVLDGR